jgi:hypothetical protein
MTTENMSDLAQLSFEELEDELATLASHLYAGTCRWLELVGELDRRGDWAESGCGSCAEWLAWRCALLPRAAREHVRVARRLPELPRVHAAFARGELSYAKVRALTRVAEADSEQELLELAQVMTAAQLERALSAYRRVTTAEANELQEEAHLTTYWDADGSLVIRGRLAPEEGALFLRALEAARDSLWEHARREGAVPRNRRGPRSAEALAALAEAALASRGDRGGGERYQVVVHVDADALASEEEAGCASTTRGAGACRASSGLHLATPTSWSDTSTRPRSGRTPAPAAPERRWISPLRSTPSSARHLPR